MTMTATIVLRKRWLVLGADMHASNRFVSAPAAATSPPNVRPAGTLQIALKHLALEPLGG